MKSNIYLCNECFATEERNSNANTIKSMCDLTGKNTVLTKMKNVEELATKLQEKFLPNLLELNSFTPKQVKFLQMAFEQGSMVTYNSINRFKK